MSLGHLTEYSRRRCLGGIGAARPRVTAGKQQDDLVTEQISANRPSSDYTPQISPDQLPVGSATGSPANDAPLLALEKQNTISAELLAVQRLCRDQQKAHGPAARPSTIETRVGARTYEGVVTQQIESILGRLYPIERAIIQTPACTMVGLGVKARHAAYVMSQYWEAPLDRIDWDARAVRLLIEAICDFARTPLPFRKVSGEE